MRLRSNLLSLIVGALALVGLSGQAHASSITLTQAIVSGISSLDGNFTFSNFSAGITGAISHNTDDYLVTQLASGFELTGGFLVADGNSGDMALGYTVTAKPGILITDVHLFMNGTFTPSGLPGNAAAVTETILDGSTPIANLATSGSSGAGDVFGLTADHVFGSTYSTLNVRKDISVTTIAGGLGSVAHISIVDQTYTFIPEPGTLLLGSFGLLGLATLGRKRVR